MAWTVERHLAGRPAFAVALYWRSITAVETIGPFTYAVSKTTITLKGGRRGFAGARPFRHGVRGYLHLQREAHGPQFVSVAPHKPVRHRLACVTDSAPAGDEQADGELEGAFWPIPEILAFHGDVWHYTNATGFEAIVRTGELRASSAVLLNDPHELMYGAKRISRWWKKNRHALEGEASQFVSVMDAQLDGFEETVLNNPAYVVCASEKRLLSQWRNYAGTNGFAIKLDATPSYGIVDEQASPDAVRTTSTPAGQLTRLPSWVRVRYEITQQDEMIRQSFSRLSLPVGPVGRLIQQEDFRNAATLIEATIAGLAACLKHPAYREEREVRLIAYLPKGRRPNHYPAAQGVVPFVRMMATDNPFLDAPRPYRRLPIKGVRVGPPQGQTERQRILGAKSLLRSHGFDAPVKGSGIPFIP